MVVTGPELEPTRAPVVSREEELDLLRRFFAADGQAAGLVLSGEPGIGKTTLWEAGLEMAVAQGGIGPTMDRSSAITG